MPKGRGWFVEKGFGRSRFEIEVCNISGKIIGKTFNEIAANGIKMPPAKIYGTLKDDILEVDKKYDDTSHSQIHLIMKRHRLFRMIFKGLYTVCGCSSEDFNCWRLLEKGKVKIVLYQSL